MNILLNILYILQGILTPTMVFICYFIYFNNDVFNNDINIRKNFKYIWLGFMSSWLVILVNMIFPFMFQSMFTNDLFVYYINNVDNVSYYTSYNTIYSDLCKAFIQIGLTEELCKGVMIYFAVRNVKNDLLTCLFRAMLIGFGFSLLENIHYMLYTGSLHVLFERSVVPVFIHISLVLFTFVGLIADKYNFKIEGISKYSFVNGLICAVFWHGLYDYVLMYMPELTSLFMLDKIIFVTLSIHAIYLVKEFLKKEKIQTIIN